MITAVSVVCLGGLHAKAQSCVAVAGEIAECGVGCVGDAYATVLLWRQATAATKAAPRPLPSSDSIRSNCNTI